MSEAPFSKASTEAINLAATNLQLLTLMRRDIDPTVRFAEGAGFDAATITAEHATPRALTKHLQRLLELDPRKRAIRLAMIGKPLPIALRVIWSDSKGPDPLVNVYNAGRPGVRRGFVCAECGDITLDGYMVTDDVWKHELGLPKHGIVLHLTCLAARLPRPLTPADFPDLPVNAPLHLAFGLGTAESHEPEPGAQT